MSEAIDQGTVLVIGGRGKTGARVADRLEAKGVDVRLASRASSPAFDWTDRSTWPAAIAGARAAYIVYYPDLATPGAVEAIRDFTALAIEHGMKRLVLLSGRGEPEAQAAEEELMRSGADWTVVRASWFAQNFSESLLAPGIMAAMGYNGRGLAAATALGKVLADWAAGAGEDELPFPVAPPRRIPFHFLRKPAVAAVVAWSRWRDG